MPAWKASAALVVYCKGIPCLEDLLDYGRRNNHRKAQMNQHSRDFWQLFWNKVDSVRKIEMTSRCICTSAPHPDDLR